MRRTVNLIFILTLLTSLAAAAPSDAETTAGLTPASPFYFTEQIVEGLEVEIAGLIGGQDLKAKSMANNADERLAEAQKMKSKNKTSQADKLTEKYEEQINRSKKVAERSKNPDTRAEIGEVSKRNTEVLKEIKKRTPSQADKGLEKAMNKSDKTGEQPQKDLPDRNNQDSMREDGSQKPDNISDNTINKSEEVGDSADVVKNDIIGPDTDIKSDKTTETVNKTHNIGNTTSDLGDNTDRSSDNETLEDSSESITGNTVEKPSNPENPSNSDDLVDETTGSTGLN